jgi:hypothetical protein
VEGRGLVSVQEHYVWEWAMKEWIVAWFTVHERMLFEDGGI